MKSAADPQEEGRPSAEETARPMERRASERVRDDQQSGQGAASAWSKLKMLERKRASLQPRPDAD